MNKLQILDCTLRDGGYCNKWEFGADNIKKILHGLIEADIDIIECGFLTNRVAHTSNITKYNEIEQLVIQNHEQKQGKKFVLMANYGEYDFSELPENKKNVVDGIRLAFHKKNMREALSACKIIKAKGYKVFVQPMVSMGYTDEEFLKLIELTNEFQPYAFYIVDSFGVMKRNDLTRLFYLVDHNLGEDIIIGYHSHNNLQLAYSNAQSLMEKHTKHNLIIDSSVYGMGRGAGNLNTELLTEYLNDNYETDYKLSPLLKIIDEVLVKFYNKNSWGYSLPNYLSATNNCHPNYAIYLDNRNTLTIEDMNAIFGEICETKKKEYDEKYIEKLYINYMNRNKIDENDLNDLEQKFIGKDVLLIASGQSVKQEKEKVKRIANNKNVITISTNYEYPYCAVDYIFVSNLRRFKELNSEVYYKTIITSNIESTKVCAKVPFEELLNTEEMVQDNASLMLIELLKRLGVNKIYLAGLDGYSVDESENYVDETMSFLIDKKNISTINKGIEKKLLEFSKEIELEYVTTCKYVSI